MWERRKYPTNALIRAPLTLFMFGGLVGSVAFRSFNYLILVAVLISVLGSFIGLWWAKILFFTYLTLTTALFLPGLLFLQILAVEARRRGQAQVLYQGEEIKNRILEFCSIGMANLVVGLFLGIPAIAEGERVHLDTIVQLAQIYTIFFIMLPMALPLIIRVIYTGGKRIEREENIKQSKN